MNIVHIGLTGPYTENMAYQDNMLPKYNALDGHNVTYLATQRRWINGVERNTKPTEPLDYVLEDTVRVIRLPFVRIFNKFITDKVRLVSGIDSILQELAPDIILVHGPQTLSLLDIVKYKRENQRVKLYIDSHSDANNTANNLISFWILHKIFYRLIVRKCITYIDKWFYLSYEARDFLIKMYKVPIGAMEFYPLGGTIFANFERDSKRNKTRESLGLEKDHILFLHSGKMDRFKRTTDILEAFKRVRSSNVRLVLIGTMTDDVKEIAEPLINSDPRVSFIGWKTADELMDYLCAADVYVQPGSQSATMQNAICCGCAVVLYPHKSHEAYLRGNGYYIESVDDMESIFQEIDNDPSLLEPMRDNSLRLARDILDYGKLARRLYV